MEQSVWESTQDSIAKAVETALKKLKISTRGLKIEHFIEEPPSDKMGDLACSIAFPLGKKLMVSPRQVAEQLLDTVKKPPLIEKVKLAGAYVNFFLNRQKFAEKVISSASKETYGKGHKQKEKIMVEYSQPNPLKVFHIGHIRGTVLGESLSRILKYNGYETVQVNLFNDTGSHIAKCVWNYITNFNGQEPPSERASWLGKLYTDACRRLDEGNKTDLEAVAEVQKKLENQDDEELMEIWHKLREWSIKDFKKIYTELDAHFDHDFYDSDLKQRGKEIVQELLKKKIAKKSEGAVIVNLKKEGLDIFLILRQDGTALYSTQDLSLAEEKFKKFKVNRSIYVVGSEQRLHFQQLFKTLELMGFKQAKKCYHLAFDLVTLRSGKMSSRDGTAILYKKLRGEMVNRALREVIMRNPEMPREIQVKVAKTIALGAMKFSMLNISNNKTIFFDWDKALAFEGETGPYIQYAAVRSNRILEKAKKVPDLKSVDFSKIEMLSAHNVVKYISKFPVLICESAEDYKPHLLAHYAYKLAEKFSTFYNEERVIDATTAEERDAKLLLVKAFNNTILLSLNLLGIEVPERM